MNVVNKALVQSLDAPTLVTAAQMFMTVFSTLLLARDRLQGDTAEVLKWSFVSLLFFGMLCSSFFSYKYLTLSMLMVIRNLGPIITLPIEYVIMSPDKRPVVNVQMILALSLVLVSSLAYFQKIEVSLAGIGFAFLNMVLAITDRITQRRLLTTECRSLSTETCMLLNNVLGMIPTLTLGLYLGEFKNARAAQWFMSADTILLVLSGIIGTGICYFALAVQREISATSFMVLQNGVRAAVVVVGVVVFLDPISWPWQIVGLALSFTGTLWYGRATVQGAQELRAAAQQSGIKQKIVTKTPEGSSPQEVSKADTG
jgi:solute carrier family 35 protein